MSFLSGSSKWNPRGKHVYVTGGSSGLGLSLAIELAKRGAAHLSLVARDEAKLATALAQVRAACVDERQRVSVHAFSVGSAEGAEAALAAATREAHGGDDGGNTAPDAVFLCAGAAHPGFWVEATAEDLTCGMQDGYWLQAWTAWAATRMMVHQQRKGKVVFVSSTLGYMSIPGYATYSPAKHALRGLADTLRPEMLLYGIDVHIFFPPTMYTPGYENENATKPALTLEIEKDDKGLTPEQAALGLLKGIEQGHAHITADFLTSLFRASTRGSAPGNGVLDPLLNLVASIAVPIWRSGLDKQIKAHAPSHQEYLAKKGGV